MVTITQGPNRTGIKASPIDAERLLDQAELQLDVPMPAADGDTLRAVYIEEADPVGSMPPPGSLKGMVGAITARVQGMRLHVLLDKLGERAAYERTGTRLYDAAIRKVQVLESMEGTLPGALTAEALGEIRDDEASHFAMLCEAIESLGGDPTVQTPCADMAGVQGLGLVQAINEPRATLAQTLQTLLAAEVVDVASWELLAELAEGFGEEEMTARFREALRAEELHEQRVTAWLRAALSVEGLGDEDAAQPDGLAREGGA